MEKTEKLTLRECLIGDRAFYRHVLVVVLPIIVQNTLTNVVSLLDNVMVGQVGTLPMSGVAVVGQLLFVYNLAVWGSTAGAGIFGAQFYGRGDMEGCFSPQGPRSSGPISRRIPPRRTPPRPCNMPRGICALCSSGLCPSA